MPINKFTKVFLFECIFLNERLFFFQSLKIEITKTININAKKAIEIVYKSIISQFFYKDIVYIMIIITNYKNHV